MPLDPLNIPLGVFSLEAAEAIANAIGEAGAPPGGATGDVQFNNDGVFGAANDVAAGCSINLDTFVGSGLAVNIVNGGVFFTSDLDFDVIADAASFQCTSGNMQFTADSGGVGFTAENGEISFETQVRVVFRTPVLNLAGLQVFADNAAALLGGLEVGDFYRTGADPDPVCVVH